ncbi:VOC family protein [Amycolatopsis sp. cmx-4-68]|uniref:VOC family protein n=1 Tax=Amycolatopsis sp. cmx-4-68 TaxID=2790938 RepID=UPI00397A73A8
MTGPNDPPTPFALPVHHVAYAVPDLEAAIEHAARTLGAGPFLLLEDIPLQVTSRGEPARFLHSSAFGRCGALALELMQIKDTAPDRITGTVPATRPGLHHFGYVTSSPDEVRAQLEAMGIPAFLEAVLGDIAFTMHDATHLWGHSVEVHADTPGIRAFWRDVHESSAGWDGRDPIRRPGA